MSTAADPKVRILVVEDQAIIRRGLTLILGTVPDLEVVGQAADGEEAIALARSLVPDVILMDLQLPKVSGVNATRAICAEHSHMQVVVLTTFDSEEMVFEAIRAGAQAYLLKDADESEVVETIRAVHRGESRLAPHIARKVIEQFRAMSSEAPPTAPSPSGSVTPQAEAPPAEALTEREAAVLELIAEGLANRDIAKRLFLAEGTVKNYVSRIMEKLHTRTRTELAVKALRRRG